MPLPEVTTLPSGKVVCKDHHLVICPYCTMDLSYMDNLDEHEELADEAFTPNRLRALLEPASDTVLASLFHPPPGPVETNTPAALFPAIRFSPFSPIRSTRFVRRDDPREFLIYTDGACLENGRDNASAGFAFVYRPLSGPSDNGYINGRLENCGSHGRARDQTSNRAELRAVIAALEFRAWIDEGFRRLVIATDSSYVVKGATEWIGRWQNNGWRAYKRKPVMNQDLWKRLISNIKETRLGGLEVCFWQIPRKLNSQADQGAKEGAKMGAVEKYQRIEGWAED